MESKRQVALRPTKIESSTVICEAELGYLLLGDRLEFAPIKGDSLTIMLLDNFWLLKKSGSGGFSPFCGGGGKSTKQPLQADWQDKAATRRLMIYTSNATKTSADPRADLQDLDPVKRHHTVEDSGRICLIFTMDHTQATLPDKDGYDSVERNPGGYGLYPNPTDLYCSISR